MVMRAPWLPQVTQWTSLTVDSMGVLQHPNAMYNCRHTHTHMLGLQQGGMFQLAVADRCCAAFVCMGERVEGIVSHLSEELPSEPDISITQRRGVSILAAAL